MSEETKPAYHAEINRILDIAVAEENTRLAEGGAGVGDLEDIFPGAYAAHASSMSSEIGERADTMAVAPVQEDDYQNLIAPAANRRRLDEIRGRVMSYPENVRVDVGFLLLTIDAYESGKL